MTIENRDGLGWMDGQNLKGMHLQGLYKASMGNGVLYTTVTSLKVSQSANGPGMDVDIAAGSCKLSYVVYTEVAQLDLAIGAAHATDERIDLIVYDQSAGTCATVAGTAHATDPQIPDVTDDNDIPLAFVYVVPQDDGGYTGTIVNGDITDLRAFVNNVVLDKCSIYDSNATQAITTATDTPITFDSEVFDTNTMHDTGSNTSRITIKTAGYYLISGLAKWAGNAVGARVTWIRLNGSGSIAENAYELPPHANYWTQVVAAKIVSLAVNDYIELCVHQTSGGNLNVSKALDEQTSLVATLIR